MKIFEDLREHLEGNVVECMRCQYELKDVKIHGKTSPEIECPRCGLIIALTSRKNRLINLIVACAILALMVGFIVGTSVGGIL